MAPYQQQEYVPQVQSQLPQIDSNDKEAFAFLQEHEYIQIREENDRLFTENRNLKHIVQVLRKMASSLIDPDSLSQFVLQHQQEQEEVVSLMQVQLVTSTAKVNLFQQH